MPPAAVHQNGSVPDAELLSPTMTEPSAEAARAVEELPPGKKPRPAGPAEVHRAAWPPAAFVPAPTTVEPSAEAPVVCDESVPGSRGSAAKPAPAVQRNGRTTYVEVVVEPKTTVPSDDSPTTE